MRHLIADPLHFATFKMATTSTCVNSQKTVAQYVLLCSKPSRLRVQNKIYPSVDKWLSPIKKNNNNESGSYPNDKTTARDNGGRPILWQSSTEKKLAVIGWRCTSVFRSDWPSCLSHGRGPSSLIGQFGQSLVSFFFFF